MELIDGMGLGFAGLLSVETAARASGVTAATINATADRFRKGTRSMPMSLLKQMLLYRGTEPPTNLVQRVPLLRAAKEFDENCWMPRVPPGKGSCTSRIRTPF